MLKFLKNIFLVFLLSIGCAHNNYKTVSVVPDYNAESGAVDSEMKRRNLSEYFVGSGIIKYFLPDLPQWSNFSQTASCKRSSSKRYLDYKNLRESFSLNYEQAVQFQYMFNQEYQRLKQKYKTDFLLLPNEENLFFRISDMVQGNIKEFKKPEFNRVHLVWIDPFINNNEDVKKLKKLMENKIMDEGHPVFISLCLDEFEFNLYLEKNELGERNIRVIPYDMFSVFNEENLIEAGYGLNIVEMMAPNQTEVAQGKVAPEIHLFLPSGYNKPVEFKGKFVIHYF